MLAVLLVLLGLTLASATIVIYQTIRLGTPPLPSNRAMRAAIARLLADELSSTHRTSTAVLELGSGWGGLSRLLALANPRATFLGLEPSLVPRMWSRLVRAVAGPANLRFARGELQNPLSDRWSVIVVYLAPAHMDELSRVLAGRTGTVVVSAAFALPGHEPERVHQLRDLYRTPVYRYRL